MQSNLQNNIHETFQTVSSLSVLPTGTQTGLLISGYINNKFKKHFTQ